MNQTTPSWRTRANRALRVARRFGSSAAIKITSVVARLGRAVVHLLTQSYQQLRTRVGEIPAAKRRTGGYLLITGIAATTLTGMLLHRYCTAIRSYVATVETEFARIEVEGEQLWFLGNDVRGVAEDDWTDETGWGECGPSNFSLGSVCSGEDVFVHIPDQSRIELSKTAGGPLLLDIISNATDGGDLQVECRPCADCKSATLQSENVEPEPEPALGSTEAKEDCKDTKDSKDSKDSTTGPRISSFEVDIKEQEGSRGNLAFYFDATCLQVGDSATNAAQWRHHLIGGTVAFRQGWKANRQGHELKRTDVMMGEQLVLKGAVSGMLRLVDGEAIGLVARVTQGSADSQASAGPCAPADARYFGEMVEIRRPGAWLLFPRLTLTEFLRSDRLSQLFVAITPLVTGILALLINFATFRHRLSGGKANEP